MLTPRQVFDRTVDAFNSGQIDTALSMTSPDVVLTAPGGLDFKGLAGMRQWFDLWSDACPDRRVKYHNVLVQGDQLIGEGTFTGTHTGPLHLPTGDVPPTGRKLAADYVAVFHFAGEKITYMRHYMDLMGVMAQLGLLPSPEKVG